MGHGDSCGNPSKGVEMHKILIADDEPIECMVAKKFMESHYDGVLEVVMASNGNEAVSRFEAEHCEIALLDIEMPGMNGLEAAERIRSQFPNAQIIFLTAFDEFDYAKKAIAVHALEYLLKPMDDNELMMTIDEAIRHVEMGVADGQSANALGGATVAGNDSQDLDRSKLGVIKAQIASYLDENYMRDVALGDVAGMLNYSDAYFCKVFKQCFGVSFVMYLAQLRIRKAKEMLADVTINIKEISGLVGYQDPNYFTKVFKRMVDVTPSEYRLRVLNGGSECK